MKAWADRDQGIVGQYRDDQLNPANGFLGRGAAIRINDGKYTIAHMAQGGETGLLYGTPPAVPTGGWDHVVATWSGPVTGQLRFYLNNALTDYAVTNDGALNVPAASGIEIGSWGYDIANGFQGEIAEVAIYDKVLGEDRIMAHHDAGRYGGVRESVVNQSANSFDEASRIADRELLRWSNVLYDVNWDSFQTGWRVGDLTYVSVSGVGITYSGLALIQEAELRYMGGQTYQTTVRTVGSRMNVIDYYRALTDRTDSIVGQGAVINLASNLVGDTIIAVGGRTFLTDNDPPFYIAPDPETGGSTPYAKVEFSCINLPGS